MHKTIIGLAVLAFGASGQAAAQTGWQVSEATGDVRIVVNGQARPVTRGMLLASGSTIASGARARAVLVNGRDYVILSPSSRVRLPAAAQVRPASAGWLGAAGANMTQVVSEAGTALYRIEHRANPHFRVQTPYLAAVVKGTVFSVTVNGSGASVQVTQGAVEVSTVDGGAAELVRPGMVATVEAGDLMELNIQGAASRSIRSNGTPLPGVATVPVADAGRYEGPSDTFAEVTAPVPEEPVSFADATDGLVSGHAGADLALNDVREESRPVRPGAEHNQGGGNDNAGNGGGNDNSGPGNNNGGGNDNAGSGGGNDNSGPGNNNGGGNDNAGNGGGNDNSGPGNNNGGGNDNSGPGNNNGGGNDDTGSDDDGGNSGSGGQGGGRGNGGASLCLPGDVACTNPGGQPRR